MKLDIYPTAALHPGTAPVAQATGRSRLRSYAGENGFVAAEAGPDADVDEFIRGDRIVHIRYGPDERITDVLVNGQSLFNRERSVAAHHKTMAERQRAGIGLTYGDDGHWIADHLHGAEKSRAEARADRAWARTHRYCPHSTQVVNNPAGRLVIYRCPECGQDVGLDAAGTVLPHSAWISGELPR
jgi:hypothetical protein